jgi:hypothetical protein
MIGYTPPPPPPPNEVHGWKGGKNLKKSSTLMDGWRREKPKKFKYMDGWMDEQGRGGWMVPRIGYIELWNFPLDSVSLKTAKNN